MTQTLALFLDAYRDLNARKLFWITLTLSGMLMLSMFTIGVDNDAIIFFFKWRWEVPDASFIYRELVVILIAVDIWLSWGAVILAMISTAGIFPDLIAGGAIDLYLSKPISRLRLFLTKYATGLLFVMLQLTVFCTGLFFVAGIRLHEWRPALFLPILFVTLLFSYIFSFAVLLGVWTRSTVAALLMALLLWMSFSAVQWSDSRLMVIRRGLEMAVQNTRADIAYMDAHPAMRDPLGLAAGLQRKRRETFTRNLADFESNLRPVAIVEDAIHAAQVVLPKTAETNDLLDRYLISDKEIADEAQPAGGAGPSILGLNSFDLQNASLDVQRTLRHRSVVYIIGSSLLCEALVVGAAAWLFCRRDY